MRWWGRCSYCSSMHDLLHDLGWEGLRYVGDTVIGGVGITELRGQGVGRSYVYRHWDHWNPWPGEYWWELHSSGPQCLRKGGGPSLELTVQSKGAYGRHWYILNLKLGLGGRKRVSCLEVIMRGVKNTYATFRHNEWSLWKKKQPPLEKATDFLHQMRIKATFVNPLTAGICNDG